MAGKYLVVDPRMTVLDWVLRLSAVAYLFVELIELLYGAGRVRWRYKNSLYDVPFAARLSADELNLAFVFSVDWFALRTHLLRPLLSLLVLNYMVDIRVPMSKAFTLTMAIAFVLLRIVTGLIWIVLPWFNCANTWYCRVYRRTVPSESIGLLTPPFFLDVMAYALVADFVYFFFLIAWIVITRARANEVMSREKSLGMIALL